MVAITIGYISMFREFQMDLFRCSRNVCSPEELTRTICETRHIKIQRKLKYRSENIVDMLETLPTQCQSNLNTRAETDIQISNLKFLVEKRNQD